MSIEMFQKIGIDLGQNLMIIGMAFALYFVSVIAYIIAKTYYNTKNLKEIFQAKKLGDGLLKALSIGLSESLIGIILVVSPYLLMLFKIEIPDMVLTTYTVTSIVMTFYKAISVNVQETIATIGYILTKRNIVEDAGFFSGLDIPQETIELEDNTEDVVGK